jgi:hypothetical protein
MTDDRKKPGWAFWTTVAVVVVLVGYPLSFGPACWIVAWANENAGAGFVNGFYRPVIWTHNRSFQRSGRLHKVISWYSLAGCGKGTDWGLCPVDWDGPVPGKPPEFFWYHDAR